ncbi:unnamed protein product [Caretta caretta]
MMFCKCRLGRFIEPEDEGDTPKPLGVVDECLLRQVFKSLGSDPCLADAVPMLHEKVLDSLLLLYQKGYTPEKAQTAAHVICAMYCAVDKLVKEQDVLERQRDVVQESLEQELEKLKLQNESLKRDLQTSNVTCKLL